MTLHRVLILYIYHCEYDNSKHLSKQTFVFPKHDDSLSMKAQNQLTIFD
jgi:hypothetical protein